MIKRVFTSFFVSIIPAILLETFISRWLAKKEIADLVSGYYARGISFPDAFVLVGYPVPYDCIGLCVHDNVNMTNQLLDTLVFLIPVWVFAYALLSVRSKKK